MRRLIAGITSIATVCAVWLCCWHVGAVFSHGAQSPTIVAGESQTGEPLSETDIRILDLIQRLGDEWFPEREIAQRELIQLGHAAYDSLIEAEQHSDPEVVAQVHYLLRLLHSNWVRETDSPEVRALMSDYEGRGVSLRLQRIRDLADLPDAGGLEALCRIVKYETSEVVSKTAALAVLNQDAGDIGTDEHERRLAMLHSACSRSPRVGAAWIKAFVLGQTDPAGAVPRFAEFIAREEWLLNDFSDLTQPRIIVDLRRIQVVLFDELSRADDVNATLTKMLELDVSNTDLLVDLVQYFTRRQAWNLLDELESRAAESLSTDALALYQLAESRQQQGDEQRSLATAERAVKVSARRTADHVQMAILLLDKGLQRWADYEFAFVLDHDPPGSAASLAAAIPYSESLHDRGLHRQAGEVRKRVLDAVENDPDRPTLQAFSQMRSTAEEFSSRMHYYFACHHATLNDTDQRREELKKAIEINPTDEDVLIAMFHLPNQSDDDRQSTREKVRDAVEKNRESIRKEPEDSTGYNQLAWLVANTEGDFDEAISLAQRAIQLRRDEAARLGVPSRVGGYYDTLAHCYAAKKDFVNAVKTQTEAARLDPHSKQIADKLAVFKRQLAEQHEQDQPTTNP